MTASNGDVYDGSFEQGEMNGEQEQLSQYQIVTP